jgi:hypothetical protein
VGFAVGFAFGFSIAVATGQTRNEANSAQTVQISTMTSHGVIR